MMRECSEAELVLGFETAMRRDQICPAARRRQKRDDRFEGCAVGGCPATPDHPSESDVRQHLVASVRELHDCGTAGDRDVGRVRGIAAAERERRGSRSKLINGIDAKVS